MKRFISVLSFMLCLSAYSCTQTENTENVQSKTQKVEKQSTTKYKTNKYKASPSTLNSSKANRSTSRPKDQINAAFPFDIPLKDAQGNLSVSADVFSQKKPTVLMFWLTTCAPCHRKMAELVKVYDEMKEEADFELIAISGDYPKNYPSFVKQVEKKNWPWPTFNDVNREFRQVLPGGLNGYPQTFVFDKNGEIAYQKRKYLPGDLEELNEVLKSL